MSRTEDLVIVLPLPQLSIGLCQHPALQSKGSPSIRTNLFQLQQVTAQSGHTPRRVTLQLSQMQVTPSIQKEAVRSLPVRRSSSTDPVSLVDTSRQAQNQPPTQQHLGHSEPGIPPMSHHGEADFHTVCERFPEH